VREFDEDADVEVHHAGLRFDRRIGVGAGVAEARIVDENINREATLGDLGGEFCAGIGNAEVRGDGCDFDVVGFGEAVGDVLERAFGACGEDEIVATAGEALCQVDADAGGGAGDEGCLSGAGFAGHGVPPLSRECAPGWVEVKRGRSQARSV